MGEQKFALKPLAEAPWASWSASRPSAAGRSSSSPTAASRFRRTPESWHMATSKNGPTLAALNAQIAALQAQADALRKKEVAEVIAKVKDAIAHYGLTAADLGFGRATGQAGRPPSVVGGKPAMKGRKKAVAKPSAKAVKFKDDHGHTWGGIGKRPDWFKAALAAGKTPEDLLAKG